MSRELVFSVFREFEMKSLNFRNPSVWSLAFCALVEVVLALLFREHLMPCRQARRRLCHIDHMTRADLDRDS